MAHRQVLWSRWCHLAVVCGVLAVATTLSAQAASGLRPAASPDGLKTVVIFPYTDQGGFLLAEHRYALFTVPDMVRLTLLEDQSIQLVERSTTEVALKNLATGADGASEADRQTIARSLGADHYIWGYILSTAGKVNIFHYIVDAGTGRVVHISSESIPADDGLFDALSASARGFATWIRQTVPPRSVETVIVERQVAVDRQVPVPAGDRMSLNLGGGGRFFIGALASSLNPAPFGDLVLIFGKGATEPFRFGLRLDMTYLSQKGKAVFGNDSAIQILDPALAFETYLLLPLGGGWHFVSDVGLGVSLIFGKVDTSLLFYPRLWLTTGLGLRLDLLEGFQLGFGVRGNAVFNAWQTQAMLDLAPFLELVFIP